MCGFYISLHMRKVSAGHLLSIKMFYGIQRNFLAYSEGPEQTAHPPVVFLMPVITKTCLYNFDPLKPHFYIIKLGFTGVYIIFHISAKNIYCRYSLEPPRRGGSNEYPQSMF